MKNQVAFKISLIFSKMLNSKYKLLLIAGIILICWMPILIMMFPGTVINDSWSQIDRFISLTHGGIINDHHPILDTLITGGYISVFVKIFGNWDFAFFSYVLFQAIATCLALSGSIIYAYDVLKLKKKALAIFLLIYCLFPVFPLITQTISKDAIFCWIYILFFIQFIEFVRTNGESLKKWKPLLLFVATIILCALTKKVGLYVIAGSLVVSVVFIRTAWKQILFSLLSLLIMMFGIMPFVLGLFKIEKGGLQEMMSLPFQMTARYSIMYDDATDSEKATIENVLGDYETLAQKYVPNNADPVKGGEQLGQDNDYVEYIKTWFKQGLRHPDAYLAAMVDMLSGWFSFNQFKPLMNMDWHNWITDSSYASEKQTHRHQFFEKTSRFLEKVYDSVYATPVVGVVFSFWLYTTFLPLLSLILLIVSRKKHVWIAFTPLALSIMLGCWLSPVSDTMEGSRYLFPIVMSLPLLFMWCVYSLSTKAKASSKRPKLLKKT